MKNKPLDVILAANLRFFMERPGCPYPNANALGVAAGISPNTVRNYLEADRRIYQPKKKEKGYPTLDKIELLANKLNCSVWELLHPDIQRSLKEREMYLKIESNFKSLPPAFSNKPEIKA